MQVDPAVPRVLARRRARVVDRHGDLKLARVKQAERIFRLLLADPDGQGRAFLAEPDDGLLDERADRGRQGPDPDVAHAAVRPGVQGRAGPLGEFPHALGVREQHPRLAGQHDAAAAPFQQRHADVPRQARKLLGDPDGVRYIASAVAAMVPRRSSSWSSLNFRQSTMKSQLTLFMKIV